MRTFVLAALATVTVATRPAAAQMTAPAAYDTVQRIRAEADSLAARGDGDPVVHLHRALRFLRQPAVRDLAQGWPYLRSRAPNVWWDIAVAATRQGDSAAALDAIEQVRATGGSSAYAEWIGTDSTISRWRHHPRVVRVIDQLRQQRRLWGDSAFVSPFKDTLPESERVAGLSLLWAEVRYGYPDFAQRPELDWDSLYLDYLPRVRAAPGSFDYFRTLMRFVAALGDSHTNVYFPAAIRARLARPPLGTRLVENRVLITSIGSPTLTTQGLRMGDEIVTIDGVAVRQYAEREVAPYQSASTPQDLALRTYGYQLLAGPSGVPVSLGVRRADGSSAVVSVDRSGYPDLVAGRPPVTDSVLAGNVGYLRIATFGLDSIGTWARRSMMRLMGTRALIIDIRENDGGNTTVGPLAILARDTTPMASQRVTNYSALDRARGFQSQPFELGHGWIRPDPQLHYDGPVALLIGPRTFSAGEDFAVAFDLMRRGTIVGEPSGGNTGQPLGFPLPGGGFARVRTKHDHYGDGRSFLFRGVQPGVVVQPTVAGLRAGRDEVLEAALRVVRAR